MKHIKEFRYGNKVIAVLVKREFQKVGKHANFISDPNSSLQLGVGLYPKGHIADAHTHDWREGHNVGYEELLHLDRGRMRVNLYGNGKVKFASFVMRAGDTVHFTSGGHSFEMLTPCKCIEVKQGPYEKENKRFL